MSGGQFPTPLLRPAADPPAPPEFYLPPAALPLSGLSSFSLNLGVSGNGRRSSSAFAATYLASAAPEGQSERSEQLRQREQGEDAGIDGDAWPINTAAPCLVPAAVASERTASEEAAGRIASGVTRGRSRTPVTRARSCSWTCSNRNSAPERNLPTRAASITLLSGADSNFTHPFRHTHGLPTVSNRSSISSHNNSVSSGGDLLEVCTLHSSSSNRDGVSAATDEAVETSVAPSAGLLNTTQPTASGHVSTTQLETGSVVGKEKEDTKTADDTRRIAGSTGAKSALLPLSHEAAKLLGDAQSPSSRGSVSSIHTCSTRSSASGPSAPEELERNLLLSMAQQQHIREHQCLHIQRSTNTLQQQQQQTKWVLRKDVGSRAADDKTLTGNPGAMGLVGAGSADRAAVITPAGRAAAMEGTAATEESTGTGGESVKRLLHGKEGTGECVRRFLPRPFIGLSPAALKGLPDENEAAGVFEIIWADVLRREAAPQQPAIPMLESTGAAAAGAVGEELCLRSTVAREKEEEQRKQQQQPVLLSAGTEHDT